jgi:hypothetical protein
VPHAAIELAIARSGDSRPGTRVLVFFENSSKEPDDVHDSSESRIEAVTDRTPSPQGRGDGRDGHDSPL